MCLQPAVFCGGRAIVGKEQYWSRVVARQRFFLVAHNVPFEIRLEMVPCTRGRDSFRGEPFRIKSGCSSERGSRFGIWWS
jgi:hypothetical protein